MTSTQNFIAPLPEQFLSCNPVLYSLEHVPPSNPTYFLLNVHCPIFYNNTQTGSEAYGFRVLTFFFQGVKTLYKTSVFLASSFSMSLWACGVCMHVCPGWIVSVEFRFLKYHFRILSCILKWRKNQRDPKGYFIYLVND